jgi:hypothetical protein
MRLNLNLEELHVETTEMQSAYTGPEGVERIDGGWVASILWNTQTRQIPGPNTNSSPCIA